MSSSRAPLPSSACTAHATPPPRCLLGLNKPLLLAPPPWGQAPLAGCLGQTPGSPAHRLQPSCQVQLETHPLPSGSATPKVWPESGNSIVPGCVQTSHCAPLPEEPSLKIRPCPLPLRQSPKGCMLSHTYILWPLLLHPAPTSPLASTAPSLAAWLEHYLHSVTCPQTPLSGERIVQSLKGQGRVCRTQGTHLRLLAWL